MKTELKGIFIPNEILKLDLTYAEMLILAIYKYYTEEGKLKCCVYTNQSIADIINANVKTVIRAKKRLKELGYIRTDGGIRTYYCGINKGQNEEGDLYNVEEQTNKDLLDEINDQYDDFKHTLEVEEKQLRLTVNLKSNDDLDDILALINSNKSL